MRERFCHPRLRPPLLVALTLGLLGVVFPAAAPAAPVTTVRFPLTVEYELLQTALRRHLREQSGGELVVWRSEDGCRTFTLREPTLQPAQGHLLVAGPGSARVGLGLFGYCFAQLGWDGHVEILAEPQIGPDWQLRLHVLDTTLYDQSRERSGVAARVWDTVKGWAQAALPTFAYDLGPPVQELRATLGQFGAPGGPLVAALQTLRPVGIGVEPDGLKVALALDVPAAGPAPRGPEPALTPAQVKRWEATLERWDGFLTFVVKDVGTASGAPGARDELLDILLTARHDVVAVLARGPEPGPDPVQRLFVDVWSRLRVLVRGAATQPGDEGRALRYLTFLAAGDALTALTGAAPALGLEISADGLRRLARLLDPVYAGDPLEYSEVPDAALRQLFRFRDPDAPPRRQRRKPPGSTWDWLGPRSAHAEEPDLWMQLMQRLDRWVPAVDELVAYRAVVERLLELSAERTFDPAEVGERFEPLFRHLIKAVAWQESCWRQFVRQGGTVTYLVSPTHDVGIMQINVRVWRGFFNVEKLRWNAAYNAGAGTEILYNLLGRYGVREARDRFENAARATYSAYNAGPTRYRRYRLARVAERWRAVDRGFWEKYQLVAAGAAGGRVLCLPPGRT